MKRINRTGATALFLLSVWLSTGANAAQTSTINPTIPAQNAPLQSAPLRGNALAAYNDINLIDGGLSLSSNQLVGSLAGGFAVPITIPTCNPSAGQALGWTNGVGPICASISGAGSTVSVTAGNAGIVVNPTPGTGTFTIALGVPSATTLGGVESIVPVSNQFVTGISTSGVPSLGTPSISGIAAATGANSIDNASNAQTWNWSVLGTGTALGLNGTTTGSGKVLSSTLTGAANTGYAGYFGNSSTGGYALYAAGNTTVAGAFNITPIALSIVSTAFATDASRGSYFYVTLPHGGATTANAPTNAVDGQIITYELSQDSTGSGTVSWNAAFDFGTSGSPVLTTTASKIDLVAFRYSARNSKWNYLGNGLGF